MMIRGLKMTGFGRSFERLHKRPYRIKNGRENPEILRKLRNLRREGSPWSGVGGPWPGGDSGSLEEVLRLVGHRRDQEKPEENKKM
jgi:hypothetical protein